MAHPPQVSDAYYGLRLSLRKYLRAFLWIKFSLCCRYSNTC